MELKDDYGMPLFRIEAVDGNSQGHFNIASNGIRNEPDRGLVLAIGHLPTNNPNQSLHLTYNDTQGILADLVNSGIDRFFEPSYNTPDSLMSAFIASKGNTKGNGETNVLSHSGATLITNIALNQYAAMNKSNPKLYIKYYGPASSVDNAVNAALNAAGLSEASAIEKSNWIHYGDKHGSNERNLKGFEYLNHPDDTVANLIGWNIGKPYKLSISKEKKEIDIPGLNNSNFIKSLIKSFSLMSPDSVHGTYRWNDPATWTKRPEHINQRFKEN
jgi:hypothetical protein